MKYSFTLFQPPEKAVAQVERISSSVTFLLIASRRRCVPASGANVRPLLRTFWMLHHELPRKIIRAQARHREIDLARLTVVEQTVSQCFKFAVIGGRKAGQRDLTVAGIFEGFDCLFT